VNYSAHFGRSILDDWRCMSLHNSTVRRPIYNSFFIMIFICPRHSAFPKMAINGPVLRFYCRLNP
jgi:hypothetical protein